MSGNALRADLAAFIGAPGSGKTLLLQKRLAPELPPRMIWSPKEAIDRYAPQFGELVQRDWRRLAAVVDAGRSVVYLPERGSDEAMAEDFDFFCRLARRVGNRRVLVEEMHLVCSSRSSPAAWTTLVIEGRAYGLALMAATGTPNTCDAALLDVATEIFCGRLNSTSSKKRMADAMDVPLESVRGLAPLSFVHWRAGVDGVAPVAVSIPGAKPAKKSRASTVQGL